MEARPASWWLSLGILATLCWLSLGSPPASPRLVGAGAGGREAAPLPAGDALDPAEVEARLRAAVRPVVDRFRLAEQVELKTAEPLARVVNATPPDYPVGHRQQFWINDDDTEQYFQVEAELVYKTEHAYFYFQTDRLPDVEPVRLSAERFEARIRPTNNRYFGAESTPGVDNDPHITVLTAKVPGVGGYYSSSDEFPRAVNPYSNERRIIYMNRDVARPGTRNFEATLAHEYQHMIHFNEHPGDLSWVKEGLAQVAEKLNGFGGSSWAQPFLARPNLQLTTWSGGAERTPHYGASFLFNDYFFSHYGGYDAIPVYLRQPLSDTAGFDAYLTAIGRPERFDDVFADWTVANLVNDPSLAGGRYGYLDGNVPSMTRFERLAGEVSGEVRQYAANYYEADPKADASLDFSGATTVPMLPTDPPGGAGMWWSNRGDSMDSTLSRRLDLTGVTRATLEVSLWWQIEDGWDYAYVMASRDGGQTWDTLPGQYTTRADPHGANLGDGYTGKSGGRAVPRWVRERIDLSRYAGSVIRLRFEHVTDSSVNEPGFAWDELAVPEIGLVDGAEADGPWEAAGWVRLGNAVPQRFFVNVVTQGDGGTLVRRLPLDAANHGRLALRELGTGVRRLWLVVAAGAERTTEPARYTLRVDPGA